MYRSLFLVKMHAVSLQLIKKETPVQMHSCQFYEIFKNTFFTVTSNQKISLGNTSVSLMQPCTQ